ncbi:MAG: hypothetical protein R3C12_19720 [Planctomycetaceae bacterium]
MLAQLVANSPLDAAVHDAYGRLHRLNSYNTLWQFMNYDLSVYLGPEFRGEYLDRYALRTETRMPLYHLVALPTRWSKRIFPSGSTMVCPKPWGSGFWPTG